MRQAISPFELLSNKQPCTLPLTQPPAAPSPPFIPAPTEQIAAVQSRFFEPPDGKSTPSPQRTHYIRDIHEKHNRASQRTR